MNLSLEPPEPDWPRWIKNVSAFPWKFDSYLKKLEAKMFKHGSLLMRKVPVDSWSTSHPHNPILRVLPENRREGLASG